MRNPHDIIRRPILTEKSYDLLQDKTYSFEVAVDANKVEIKKAVEQVFGVTVRSVNTVRQIGKIKRQGRYAGRRPEVKRAYVKLTDDSKTIEFFEGMV